MHVISYLHQINIARASALHFKYRRSRILYCPCCASVTMGRPHVKRPNMRVLFDLDLLPMIWKIDPEATSKILEDLAAIAASDASAAN